MKKNSALAVSPDSGFSLLDVLVATVISALFVSLSAAAGLHLLAYTELQSTAQAVVGGLRLAQSEGQESGRFAAVRFAPYGTTYGIYYGNRVVDGMQQFMPGITFADGYLQLETPNIIYDIHGNSSVGGTIRLTDGWEEADIHLYLNSGLQSMGGDTL